MFIPDSFDFLFDGQSVQDWAATGGSIVLAIGLVVLCFAAWLLNLFALPGNWIGVALMGLYAWIGPQDGRSELGLVPVGAAFGLGLMGELFEFAAGAVGAQRAGASRRATIFSILGSVIGAITGGLVGIPVPIIGPVLAALLFGGLGATAGAMIAERTDGRPWRDSWRIGQAAFWGRTAGTAGKMIAGLLIVATCTIGVLV